MLNDILDFDNTSKSINQCRIFNVIFNSILFVSYTTILLIYSPVIESLYSYVILSTVVSGMLSIYELIIIFYPSNTNSTTEKQNCIKRWKELTPVKQSFYLTCISTLLLFCMFTIGEILLWFNKSELNFKDIENTAIVSTHIYLVQTFIAVLYLLYLNKY